MVQGQFDSQPFPRVVVRVFGNIEAAQTSRAHGRAERVRDWLASEGVPEERILERMPGDRPTYRGVRIHVFEACRPGIRPGATGPLAPPRVGLEEGGVAGLTREELDESLATAMDSYHRRTLASVDRQLTEHSAAAAAREAEASARRSAEVRAQAPPPSSAHPRPWWLSAGGLGEILLNHPDAVGAAGVVLGAGLTGIHAYADASFGLVAGAARSQAQALESRVGGGWVALDWLHLGLFGAHRISGDGFAEPWAEQAIYAGVEATACTDEVADGLRLCARQAWAPVGRLTRRVVDVSERLVFVPRTRHDLHPLRLSATLRQSF